jgi:hypothetical protein
LLGWKGRETGGVLGVAGKTREFLVVETVVEAWQ